MNDISMCANKKCHLKNKCKRATARPDFMQAYTYFKLNKDGTCDYFKEET